MSVVAKCVKYNTDEKWVLTHLGRHKMRYILQAFPKVFSWMKFDLNFIEVWFNGFIGPGNGFVPHRPAITRTNAGPDHWRIYALSHLNVFSITQGHKCAFYRFALNQWETALLCNDVSHWLGASLESTRSITDSTHMDKCNFNAITLEFHYWVLALIKITRYLCNYIMDENWMKTKRLEKGSPK